MKKINKFIISGTGIISTVAVLGVVISCGSAEKTSQELVDAVTKEQITAVVKDKLGAISEITVTQGQKNFPEATVIDPLTKVRTKVKRILVGSPEEPITVNLSLKINEDNKELSYQVTEVSLGETKAKDLSKLTDTITGFKENTEYNEAKKAILAIVNATDAVKNEFIAKIKPTIEALFSPHGKAMPVEELLNVKEPSRKVTIDEIGVRFETTITPDPNDPPLADYKPDSFSWRVIALTKGGPMGNYTYDDKNEVAKFNPTNADDAKITGLNEDYNQGKTAINNAVSTANRLATQTAIKDKVLFLFGAADSIKTVVDYLKANAQKPRFFTFDNTNASLEGIRVDFNLTTGSPTTNLRIDVIKLSKGGYEDTTSENNLSHLGSEIPGFKDNPAYQAAKQLIIDQKMKESSQPATKAEIKTAIEALFADQKVNTVAVALGNKKHEVIIGGGVVVSFTAVANKDDTTEMIYTITKLSKDDFEYTNVNDLKKVNDKITGFKKA